MRAAIGILSTIWRSNTGLNRPIYLLRALAWQLRKRLGLRFVARLVNGARIMVHPSSAYSGMFYERWIERKDLLFLRRHADLAPVFVDVGANVGLFSAHLFDVFDRFYLFEPAASSFAALKQTLSLNPSVSAAVHNIAIGDEPGELHFIDEGDCSSTSRAAIQADNNTVLVPVESLDGVLPATIGPFVLKVDVEGMEERVFRGAERHFHAKRPRLVMFERLGRTNLDRVRSFFTQFDYVLFYVDEDGTPTCDSEKVNRPHVNLFACPADEFPALVSAL